MHKRAKAMSISLPTPITYKSLPMRASATDPTLVFEDWPFLLPYDMAPCSWVKHALEFIWRKVRSNANTPNLAAQVKTILETGYMSSLVANLGEAGNLERYCLIGHLNHLSFWQKTLQDYPNHPVAASPELQRTSLPLTLYCCLPYYLQRL